MTLNEELYQATNKIAITIEQYKFVKYVYGFYGKNQLYDMNATMEQIIEATNIYIDELTLEKSTPYWDSIDRERVRDVLLNDDRFDLTWPEGEIRLDIAS
tara:strand:- start:5031 stop:5330 length:300 start_codon:yes stop_codon:yes gene_type:complete